MCCSDATMRGDQMRVVMQTREAMMRMSDVSVSALLSRARAAAACEEPRFASARLQHSLTAAVSRRQHSSPVVPESCARVSASAGYHKRREAKAEKEGARSESERSAH